MLRALPLPSPNLNNQPPGTRQAPPFSDKATDVTDASNATRGPEAHTSLAGKVLQVFRVGGDSERSVGRHGHPPAEPEARRSGPVQQQTISDGSGPVMSRALADSAPVAAATPPLPAISLAQEPAAAAAEPEPEPASIETIRVQTFSIDLAERLARTRAAQQEVLRELDKFDESGETLGKTVDRKP